MSGLLPMAATVRPAMCPLPAPSAEVSSGGDFAVEWVAAADGVDLITVVDPLSGVTVLSLSPVAAVNLAAHLTFRAHDALYAADRSRSAAACSAAAAVDPRPVSSPEVVL